MVHSNRAIVSSCDLERIEALLAATPEGTLPGKGALIEELERADIRPPHEMPPDVVTMNSTVRFELVAQPEREGKLLR